MRTVRTGRWPDSTSNSVAQFHANLQSRLDHFNLDRDCQAQWS